MELAFLAVLADRAPSSIRRETLQAMFWGERSEDRARHSLRQVLLHIRQACGDILDVAPGTLRLRDGAVDFDARRFVAAADERRHADAISLWTGEFLPVCEDIGGEEFRAWLEVERERLRRRAVFCFERAVAEAVSDADWPTAARRSAAWVLQFPLDERANSRHIASLCRLGRVGEAQSVRDAFNRRVIEELGDAPSAEWREDVEQALNHASEADVIVALPVAATTDGHRVLEPVPVVMPHRWAWGVRPQHVVFVTLLAAAIVIGGWRTRSVLASARGARPVLAVGRIELIGAADSAAAVPQLLGMRLSRSRELRVLSESRMQAVEAQLQSRANNAGDLERAARVAGATEIIEGVLVRREGGVWRLELRRVDLASDETRTSYSATGSDLLDLIDVATQRIAHDLRVTIPDDRFAGATTSLAAYRLYQEGLRAFYDDDDDAARRLFVGALAEDSTFAVAAYYASRVTRNPQSSAFMEQAVRMAPRTSDHDRLFIRAIWLATQNDPAQLAVAETLAVRYPAELDVHQEYGHALVTAGRFVEGVSQFRQVMTMDSLGIKRVSPRCFACDAYGSITYAYSLADSFVAAERVAREWVARQPRSVHAWSNLSGVLRAESRFGESRSALDSAAQYEGKGQEATMNQPDLWLRLGDFEAADRYWRGSLESANASTKSDALDNGISSLRIQGRYTEALAAAKQLRALGQGGPTASLFDSYHLANVLFDAREFARAGALFDSIASIPAQTASGTGRRRAWMGTHAATSYAAAGDTARVRELERVIQTEGNKSNYGRDQLLYHYVRGLLLRTAGRQTEAVDEFRRSLYSPVEGNTRAGLELGRTLLDLHRPAEAIVTLRAALAGPIGASGQYANRAELEHLLARAYDAAGQRDSAAAHYRWVLHAWRNADPLLHAARNQIAVRVLQLVTLVPAPGRGGTDPSPTIPPRRAR